MTKFRFQIQSCIDVIIDSESIEDARAIVLNNLTDYSDALIYDCVISDGEVVEDV